MTDFRSTGIELESRETEHVLRQEAAERLAAIADRLSAGGRFEFMIKGERLRVPTGDGLRFKRELTSSPATTSGWRGRSAPTSASTSAGPSPARRSTCLTTRRLAPRCRKSRNSDAAAFVLVELAKRRFYRTTARGRPLAGVHRRRERRIQRRASRWSAPSRHAAPPRAGPGHPHPSL